MSEAGRAYVGIQFNPADLEKLAAVAREGGAAAGKEAGAAAAAGLDEGLVAGVEGAGAEMGAAGVAAGEEAGAGVKTGLLSGKAGVLAAVVAVGYGIKKAFDFAEEAAQVQKSTENIKAQFGAASKSLLEFSDNAAKSFGISKAASEDFASNLGLVTKNIGLSKDQGAEMTKGLEKLAGAVGLIKGQDPAQYFTKLKSALLGNTRGLKEMGIAFTGAEQKQEALRLGIKGSTSDWTAAQKAQIIYGLAIKKLPQLMDEAKKHSGDLADEQIKLRAEFSNIEEELGAAFLPTIQKVVGFLAKYIPTAISVAGSAFKLLGRIIGAAADLVGPFVRRFVANITNLVNEFTGLRKQGYSISSALKAVAESIIVDLGGSLGTARRIVGDFVTALGLIRSGAEKAFDYVTRTVIPAFLSKWASIKPQVIKVIGDFVTGLGLIRTGAEEAFGYVTKTLIPAFIRTWEDIKPQVMPTITAFVDLAKAEFAKIKLALEIVAAAIGIFVAVALAFWHKFGGTITSVVKTAFHTAVDLIKSGLQIIRGVVEIFTGILNGDWRKVWKGVKDVTAGAFHAIIAIIKGSLQIIFTEAVAVGSAILNGIWDIVKKIPGKIGDMLGEIPGKFKNGVGDILSAAADLGTSIFHAIVGGLGDLAGQIFQWVQDALSNVLGGGNTRGANTGNVGGARGGVRHRAIGGPVTRGTTYLVGEKGPELFTAAMSGTIIPNNKLSAGIGGGVDVHVYVGNEPVDARVRVAMKNTARSIQAGRKWSQ